MNYYLLALFWILWYVNFLSRSILSPLLPVIEDALAINHAMAGSLYFSFFFGSMFSVFGAGVVSLRLGYKKLIFLCFFLLTIGFTALRFARTYELFIVFSFFLGLGSGLYIPCAIPLITTVFEKQHWGRAISIHETAAGFAILTIPILVVLALDHMEWYTIFLYMGGASLVLMLLGFAFLPDPRPVYEKQYHMSILLQRVDFWVVTITFVILGIASMGIYNIIPLFLVKERGMALDTANTLFGISRVGGFVAMILIGFILDRFSTRKVFRAIVVLTGISTVALSLVHSNALLITFLCCQATFSVVFFPAGLMLIAKITDQRERGLFTAITMGAAGIFGPGLSPIFLGALADTWSFQIGILIVGLLTIASCYCLRWLGNTPTLQKPENSRSGVAKGSQ